MAISMVRKPSENPNITNIDDIVPFRYAYGNQNGYVIGKGNEVSYSVDGNQFRINSGRLVLQGVESDIDANGVVIAVDDTFTTRFYTVYYEVNLGTNTASIKHTFSSIAPPTIDDGDDLTSNTTGTAKLELYRFKSLSGLITNVEKVVKPINYTSDIKVKKSDNSDISKKVEFNGEGATNIVKFNTLRELASFLYDMQTGELPNNYYNKPIVQLGISFKNSVSFKEDRITVSKEGEFLYTSNISGELSGGIFHIFNLVSAGFHSFSFKSDEYYLRISFDSGKDTPLVKLGSKSFTSFYSGEYIIFTMFPENGLLSLITDEPTTNITLVYSTPSLEVNNGY